jgi:hypothetical protein
MDNKNDLAQEHIEGQEKNFFFNHVKTVVKKQKEDGKFLPNLEKILNLVTAEYVIDLSKDDFELLGILCFIMGIDYTGQAYPQRTVLENVKKRFDELEITEEEYACFENIMKCLHTKEDKISEYINTALERMKTAVTDEITVKSEDKLMLKNLKAKLNKFMDIAVVPVGYAIGIVELKKEDLTYERLLKINSLLQEQASFTGKNVSKLVDVYGDALFKKLIQKSTDVFNQAKFGLLYEESIISVLESMNRFDLFINPDLYTDEEYAQKKEEFEKKLEEQQQKEEQPEEKDPEVFDKQYAESDVKDMMQNHPDEFVVSALQDSSKKYITDIDSVVNSIEELSKRDDYVQHIYMYMGQNLNSTKRVIGVTTLPETIDIIELTEVLNSKVTEAGKEYKRLAEINCAEIPEDQLNRVVTYVNDCIKSCVLSTEAQKTYLVSQLIENNITTWNHLQQILSIIETCQIHGEDALTYVNLYNYTQDKSNIVEVFENGKKLSELEIKMSIYRAFREWFKFHLPKEEEK